MNKFICIIILILNLTTSVSASVIGEVIESIMTDPSYIDSSSVIGSDLHKSTLKQMLTFVDTLDRLQNFVDSNYPEHGWKKFREKTSGISLTAKFLSADDFTLTEETKEYLIYRSIIGQDIKFTKGPDDVWQIDLNYIFGQTDESNLRMVTDTWIYFDSVLNTEMKRAKEKEYSFAQFTKMILISGMAFRPNLIPANQRKSIEESIGRNLDEIRKSYLKKRESAQ